MPERFIKQEQIHLVFNRSTLKNNPISTLCHTGSHCKDLRPGLTWSTFLILVRGSSRSVLNKLSKRRKQHKTESLLKLFRLYFEGKISNNLTLMSTSVLWDFSVVSAWECLDSSLSLVMFFTTWRHNTKAHRCDKLHYNTVLLADITFHCVFIQPVWKPLPRPLCQRSERVFPGLQPSWPSSSLWSGRTADKRAAGTSAGPTGQWWPRREAPVCRLWRKGAGT